MHDAHEYQNKMQKATSHYMWTNPNKAKDLAEDLKPIPPSKCVAGKSSYISPMMMDQINRRISPSYHFKRKQAEKKNMRYEKGAELFEIQVQE